MVSKKKTSITPQGQTSVVVSSFMELDTEPLGNHKKTPLPILDMQQLIMHNDPPNVPGIVNEYMDGSDSEEDDNNNLRGVNRPNWAKGNILEYLKFNDEGQAVEPAETVARWHRYLGMQATDHRLFRIDVFDWRNFQKSEKLDEAWDTIRRTLDWSDPETQEKAGRIRHVVEKKINDRWKTFKATLRKIWYDPNYGTEERFKCKDGRVNKKQWVKLVNHWESVEGKRRSIVNKQNRAKKRMMHTTGTKTFAQIRNIYKNEYGVNPNRCKMFELTHGNDPEKPGEPNSKQAIESMKKKIEQIKARKKASQLPEIVNDIEINEVYASVLGKENRGGVRGFGIGFRPEQVPGILVEKRGVHLEVQTLREQHEAEIEKIRKESQDREDKLREEMNEQTVATTEKLKNMEIGMKEQEALLARLFGAYHSSEMLAAMITRNGVSLQPPMVHIQPSIEHNMDDVYRPHFCEGLQQQVPQN